YNSNSCYYYYYYYYYCHGVSLNQRKQVGLTALLDDQDDPPRLLRILFQPALQELQVNILISIFK
ncbi:MAG TPA: hypothetical protein VKA87_01635, partial [Nitrososphaeraceae archaeon]|nr:hypothetical protein [Nitrososphaeraceae archaeon]